MSSTCQQNNMVSTIFITSEGPQESKTWILQGVRFLEPIVAAKLKTIGHITANQELPGT